MRHLILGLLLLAPGGALAQDRPNVILILTDDQGYGDLGSQGNPFIQTPHLDRLYAESVRLTDFHVDPVCTPTRAALLTGRYSIRTGAWRTGVGRAFLRRDGGQRRGGQSLARPFQDTPAPSRKPISSLSFRVRSASGSNPTWRY